MSLSKIYRGEQAAGLRAFQFTSFGEGAAQQHAEPAEFVADGSPQDMNAEPFEPAAPGHSAEELEEAYAKGISDGLEQARLQFGDSAQALADAATQLSRLRDDLARNSSRDMLRLVMAIAEQVIRREAQSGADVVLKIIDHALQSSVRADQYRVRVNPDDLDKVVENKPLFLASIGGLKNLSVEADPAVSRGGCLVESELGEVDATIETQLASIQQVLDEAIAAKR